MNSSITNLLLIFLVIFISFSEAKPSLKIIGGEKAEPNEFRSIVSVLTYFGQKQTKHRCGGVLIDSTTVLTSAFCVTKKPTETSEPKLKIVAGEYQHEHASGKEIYSEVKYKIIHPQFDSTKMQDGYDLAILKLESPITDLDHIEYAKLPQNDEAFEKSSGVVAGWGKTSDITKFPVKTLQKLHFVINYDSDCQANMHTYEKSKTFCADGPYKKKNICQGDFGGPFYKDENVVVGIASFALNSAGKVLTDLDEPTVKCDLAKPSYYTRISSSLTWIYSNLG